MNTIEKEIAYIEEYAQKYYTRHFPDIGTILPYVEYTLLAGGKRLRALLCTTFAQIYGAKKEDIIPFAFSIEMIHTYSLIHDDLPALDNDTMRRGKASHHTVFGEAKAILAGDSLLADAFYTMTQATVMSEYLIRAIQDIGYASGSAGMSGGQILDIENSTADSTIDSVLGIHEMKTGAIFTSACTTGAILAGASEEAISLARAFGKSFGLAFQIIDDILDEIGDAKHIGKTLGKDKSSGKNSVALLLGVEDAIFMAKEKISESVRCIERLDEYTEYETRVYKEILYDIIHKTVSVLE